MRILISALVFVHLMVPAVGTTQELELVLKPEWEVCGDQACMDFESTQRLAQMRAQYVVLYDLVPQLRQESEAWQSAATHALATVEKRGEMYERLFTVYTETNLVLEKAVEDRNRAQQFSVLHGALPWIVAGGIAVFASGIYLGARL